MPLLAKSFTSSLYFDALIRKAVSAPINVKYPERYEFHELSDTFGLVLTEGLSLDVKTSLKIQTDAAGRKLYHNILKLYSTERDTVTSRGIVLNYPKSFYIAVEHKDHKGDIDYLSFMYINSNLYFFKD